MGMSRKVFSVLSLIQKRNVTPSWIVLFPCPACGIRSCALMYIYTQTYVFMYINPIWMIYICFALLLPSDKIESANYALF